MGKREKPRLELRKLDQLFLTETFLTGTGTGTGGRTQWAFSDKPVEQNLRMDENIADRKSAATVVPDCQKAGVLPKFVGTRMMLQTEGAVFDSMRRLNQEYRGGDWAFLVLPEETGFYMRLGRASGPVEMSSPNGTSCEISNDAAGIVASLFGLCLVAERYEDEKVCEAYHALREFAKSHAEWESISELID